MGFWVESSPTGIFNVSYLLFHVFAYNTVVIQLLLLKLPQVRGFSNGTDIMILL